MTKTEQARQLFREKPYMHPECIAKRIGIRVNTVLGMIKEETGHDARQGENRPLPLPELGL